MFGLTYAEAPEAAQKLVRTIEALNHRHYSAEWMTDCEVFLWGLVEASGDDPVPWGNYDITPEIIGELRALAAECNGWIVWKDSLERDPTKAFLESGPYYVPMAEWLGYYRNRMQEQADQERAERERALMRRV